MNSYKIPEKTRVGHVHLKVSDLNQSLAFYVDLLGYRIRAKMGKQAVFIAANDYHHHIALNTWQSAGLPPANPRSVGLFHVALVYPTRKDLGVILKRILDHNYPITGASDHGVSKAIYLDDPDGNGIELYWDRPEAEWPKNSDGSIQLVTERLDLSELLRLAEI